MFTTDFIPSCKCGRGMVELQEWVNSYEIVINFGCIDGCEEKGFREDMYSGEISEVGLIE